NGKLQLNLVKRWLDDALRVESADPVAAGKWHHIAATYDGSRVADGVRVYVDGGNQKLTVLLDDLNQSFERKEALRIGGGGGLQARLRGLIDEVRIYSTALSSKAVRILATSQTLDEILADRIAERSPGSGLKLYAAFTEKFAPAELRAMFREHASAEQA